MKHIVIPRMVVISTQRQTLISTEEEQTGGKMVHSMTDYLMLYLKMWDNLKTISEALPHNLSIFKMQLNKSELVLMLDMLGDISKTMDKFNLTYFMDGGTLLGSYLYHGMVPWDDDIDIFADLEQYKNVITALDTIKDRYVVTVHSKGLLKVHSRNGSINTVYRTRTKPYPWKWPFLDIFWFRRSGSRIHRLINESEVHKISDIFPLVKRPFATLKLNSPCNPEEFLTKKFNYLKLCPAPSWSHRVERRRTFKKVKQNCSALYPVIQRTKLNSHLTSEYLEYNGMVVSSFILNETCKYEN